MTNSVFLSAAFHLTIILLLVVGLPEKYKKKRPNPPSVEVSIVSKAEFDKLTKKSKKPLMAKKRVKKKKKKSKRARPATVTEEAGATIKSKESVALKGRKKKKPKRRRKSRISKDKDFQAILKSVRNEAATRKHEEEELRKLNEELERIRLEELALAKVTREKLEAQQGAVLSEEERMILKNQLAGCWNIPAGAKNAQDLALSVEVTLDKTGRVITAEIESVYKKRYHKDSFFRTAADSAIRAVKRCSPFRGLSADRYSKWRRVSLNFDPSDLLE